MRRRASRQIVSAFPLSLGEGSPCRQGADHVGEWAYSIEHRASPTARIGQGPLELLVEIAEIYVHLFDESLFDEGSYLVTEAFAAKVGRSERPGSPYEARAARLHRLRQVAKVGMRLFVVRTPPCASNRPGHPTLRRGQTRSAVGDLMSSFSGAALPFHVLISTPRSVSVTPSPKTSLQRVSSAAIRQRARNAPAFIPLGQQMNNEEQRACRRLAAVDASGENVRSFARSAALLRASCRGPNVLPDAERYCRTSQNW